MEKEELRRKKRFRNRCVWEKRKDEGLKQRDADDRRLTPAAPTGLARTTFALSFGLKRKTAKKTTKTWHSCDPYVSCVGQLS